MPKINPRALPHVLPVKIAEAEVAKQKKLPSPPPESFPDWERVWNQRVVRVVHMPHASEVHEWVGD
jgi:hypothetical protein